MAVKDKNWSYMPVSGNDITGAFTNATNNLGNAYKALNDYLDVKTEIATGEAQNALAQAQNALEVNEVLQGALGNSFIDNSALGKSGQERLDTFFNQDITEQELNERLIAGAHGRQMAEKNYGLSSARLSHDIRNADRNYALNVAKHEFDLEKYDDEQRANALLEGYNQEVREADLLGKQLKNANTEQDILIKASGLGNKDRKTSNKNSSLSNVINVMPNGDIVSQQLNSILEEAIKSNNPEVHKSAINSFIDNIEMTTGKTIDRTKSLEEAQSFINNAKTERNRAYNNDKVNTKRINDQLLQESGSNANFKLNYESQLNTLSGLSVFTGESSESLKQSYNNYMKDPTDSNGQVVLDEIMVALSKHPNGLQIFNEIFNESNTTRKPIKQEGITRQVLVPMRTDTLSNGIKEIGYRIGFK